MRCAVRPAASSRWRSLLCLALLTASACSRKYIHLKRLCLRPSQSACCNTSAFRTPGPQPVPMLPSCVVLPHAGQRYRNWRGQDSSRQCADAWRRWRPGPPTGWGREVDHSMEVFRLPSQCFNQRTGWHHQCVAMTVLWRSRPCGSCGVLLL